MKQFDPSFAHLAEAEKPPTLSMYVWFFSLGNLHQNLGANYFKSFCQAVLGAITLHQPASTQAPL